MTEQGHGKMKKEWRGMSHPHDFPFDGDQRNAGIIKIIKQPFEIIIKNYLKISHPLPIYTHPALQQNTTA